jgi:hypothetical protein
MAAAALITPRSAARVAGMVRIAPDPDLADIVEQHWVVRWNRWHGPVSQLTGRVRSVPSDWAVHAIFVAPQGLSGAAAASAVPTPASD